MEELGFVALAFEKLKAVEASAVKQPYPLSNFKTIAKICAAHKDDIKGL